MAATSATVTSVTSSTTSAALIAANSSRHASACGPALTIANDSTAILYVLLGTGTASATNYSYQLAAKGTVPAYIELWGYRGAIQGAWATANGSALVTEML